MCVKKLRDGKGREEEEEVEKKGKKERIGRIRERREGREEKREKGRGKGEISGRRLQKYCQNGGR